MIPARASAAALLTASAVILVQAACNRASQTRHLAPWSSPPSPVLRLVDSDGKVTGKALDPSTLLLARWSGTELSREWDVDATETTRVFTLPQVPETAFGVRSARIVLRPGRVQRLTVAPLLDPSEGEERGEPFLEEDFQTIGWSIPADADPDRSLSFAFPLREAVVGKWFDAAAPGRLSGLRITASGDGPIDPRIQEVVFFEDRAVLSDSPAASVQVELGGVVRPAWMVTTGAKVEFEVDIPEGTPVLRWYDGAIGESGPRAITLRAGGSATEIRGSQTAGAWQANELRLNAWAGTRITLELSTLPPAGSSAETWDRGVGVFGTPEISSGPVPDPPPDVLVYLIDALRADRVGAFGHAAAWSPHLDRLARDGAAFTQLISSSCWTKPAVVTLMTGVHPTTHGVGATSAFDPLPPSVPVLQERFREAGWRTGSFTANPLASNLTRLERGFDAAFLPRSWAGRIGAFRHPTARQLHEAMMAWIDDAPDRPFFAFVHTLEVHESIAPSNLGSGTDSTHPYDRAVTRADTLLGEVLQVLGTRGRLHNLVVIVVSDHGESLGEHGLLGHGQSLYQTEIHIPLIFWSPARIPAGIYSAPVALADVAPTLLDLAGLAPILGAQGSSLVPVLLGETASPHESVFSSHQGLPIFPTTPHQYSMVDSRGGKLLRVQGLGDYAFDLGGDPGEQTPFLAVPRESYAELEDWLAEQHRSRELFDLEHGTGYTVIDPEDLESLQSLGYLP